MSCGEPWECNERLPGARRARASFPPQLPARHRLAAAATHSPHTSPHTLPVNRSDSVQTVARAGAPQRRAGSPTGSGRVRAGTRPVRHRISTQKYRTQQVPQLAGSTLRAPSSPTQWNIPCGSPSRCWPPARRRACAAAAAAAGWDTLPAHAGGRGAHAPPPPASPAAQSPLLPPLLASRRRSVMTTPLEAACKHGARLAPRRLVGG